MKQNIWMFCLLAGIMAAPVVGFAAARTDVSWDAEKKGPSKLKAIPENFSQFFKNFCGIRSSISSKSSAEDRKKLFDSIFSEPLDKNKEKLLTSILSEPLDKNTKLLFPSIFSENLDENKKQLFSSVFLDPSDENKKKLWLNTKRHLIL